MSVRSDKLKIFLTKNHQKHMFSGIKKLQILSQVHRVKIPRDIVRKICYKIYALDVIKTSCQKAIFYSLVNKMMKFSHWTSSRLEVKMLFFIP